MRVASETARNAGRKVAFTLSDGFGVDRHRSDFRTLIESGAIDILFANEDEACSLPKTDSFDSAADWLEGKAEVVVITRSEKGAVVLAGGERHAVPAAPKGSLVDTTRAGDMIAAGFLAGLAQHRASPQRAHWGGAQWEKLLLEEGQS